MFFLLVIITFAITVFAASPDVSSTLSNILANTNNSSRYTYPTDLTRGIVPKGLHSHNDYWRDIPFYSALSVGAVSVEADVWLYNSTLYIGHEPSALTTARTFESLYINPILDTLQRQNPSSPFVTTPTKKYASPRPPLPQSQYSTNTDTLFTPYSGVFDTASTQTLYLWVDVKTSGSTTWPYVVRALEPLRRGGWLSSTNGSGITYNPVTVIGTGNTPLNLVQPITSRDYFYDGPIPTLNSTFGNITSLVSPICSTSFSVNFGSVNGTSLNSTQLALLRDQVRVAKGKGIGTRYWDLPAWPVSTRNGVWRQLKSEGVDLINVDDLEAGAGFSDMADYW
ncbi:MAG: hypothetical protein M1835_001636 [Candelina submexicana]|nr:MAG: hypothetical protein M1835_001636 [Candelina submexicana]